MSDLFELIKTPWPYLFGAVTVGLNIWATIHLVLKNRDSRAVIGWAGLIWLVPIGGVTFYWCFGINRIRRKAVSLRTGEAWSHRNQIEPRQEDFDRAAGLLDHHPTMMSLARLGRNITKRDAIPGNRVDPLQHGDEAYPAMLKAIEEAEKSVALLSYIFDCDRAGNAFQEALVNAQNRGVEVRILIDGVGARYSKTSMIAELRNAGLNANAFLPSNPWSMKYANLRNHRKILVVDGKIGFTGGTNIREGHWLTLEPDYPVQCLHFRLEGPVVPHLMEAFAVDWAFSTGESLGGPIWFAEAEPDGPVWARGIPDGPDEDFEVLLNTLLGALAVAKERILIVTPYFLPESPLLHALSVTALRGVQVDIVVPSKNNMTLVQWASTALFDQLLEQGCNIYLSAPPFDHTKLMVVDSAWALIGSTNWDPRSLRLNFEYNVECYDERFAGKLVPLVEAKIEKAHRVTMEELTTLPFPIRLRNGLARLATPYI